MRIGLISDTHDHHHNLQLAVKRFRAEGIHIILHAGDITEATTLQKLEGFNIWVAWGNMDRTPDLDYQVANILGPGRLEHVHHLYIGGKRIALIHGNDRRALDALINSGNYDYIIHGHTHAPRNDQFQHTHIINPGALGGDGWHSGSCAILDVATGDVEFIQV